MLTKWPFYSNNSINKVTEVIKSGQCFDYSLDKDLLSLSKLFSEHLNISHILPLNSGTSAFSIALSAINFSEGDLILLPKINFPGVISPLVRYKPNIVYYDISIDGTVDKNKIIDKIKSRKFKCLFLVHLWGQVHDVYDVCKLAKEYGVFVIEDCSHAHNSSLGSKMAGSFGDVSFFSLGAYKHITGGNGGILATNNYRLYELAFDLSQKKFDSNSNLINLQVTQGNLRMPLISSILAYDHLTNIRKISEDKIRNVRKLYCELDNRPGVKTIKITPGNTTLYSLPVQILDSMSYKELLEDFGPIFCKPTIRKFTNQDVFVANRIDNLLCIHPSFGYIPLS